MEDFELGQTPVARIDLTQNLEETESTRKTVKFEQMEPEVIPEEPEVTNEPDFDDDLGTQFFATIDLTKNGIFKKFWAIF